MRGIQRIRQLMKKSFVCKMEKLGFKYNLKKDIFYREYNDMWQVIQYYLTYRARFLGAKGFIVVDNNEIIRYIEGSIKNIDYNTDAVSSQPYIEIDSITNDSEVEKSDEEILNILDELYTRIEKKLLPYLNKKTKEEIENNESKPDLSDWIRSIDIFTYLRQNFKVTPASIKTKRELLDLKFVALYLMSYHSLESKEDIEIIFNMSDNEIEDLLYDKKLYQKNASIIDDFIQKKGGKKQRKKEVPDNNETSTPSKSTLLK